MSHWVGATDWSNCSEYVRKTINESGGSSMEGVDREMCARQIKK